VNARRPVSQRDRPADSSDDLVGASGGSAGDMVRQAVCPAECGTAKFDPEVRSVQPEHSLAARVPGDGIELCGRAAIC